MSDLYTPPRASVDDREVEPRVWRNGAVAAVSSVLVLGGLIVTLITVFDMRQVNWSRVAFFLAVPPLVVGAVALRMPRLRWYWVAVCAPMAALILGLAVLWWFNKVGLLDF